MNDTTTITARNIQFGFDTELPLNWHSGDPATSRFYDALSLLFPSGERMFINSVRNFADSITDPKLKADIKAFTAQEAIHSREHARYNALMTAQGIDVDGFGRLADRVVKFAERWTPNKIQLALTCAFEHYTALFAESILGDPRVMAGAHPFYRDLWRWHAMEEEEHKAVAFDVYQTVAPGITGYLLRVYAMAIATFDFMITVPLIQFWLMVKAGEATNLRSWCRAYKHMWISPGVWRHVMFGIFDYMRPGFHPHDRAVKPEVLAWRAHYIATQRRDAVMDTSLFGES
ncbi:MAG: metal-dependent hydrolase [Parvibaculaceae bacterium]